ncbi:hypothetical protein T492DRAFT_853206 [Pavlovales sp. CCMP2436]|nr:hypothetical protein T492DRAFT_853206 [Pavlovales sp. CCMP2436]
MERAGVSASASASLDVAASLLGVDAGALAFALTHKEVAPVRRRRYNWVPRR